MDSGSLGIAGRNRSMEVEACAVPGRHSLCSMGGKLFFEPNHLGRCGISLEGERRNGRNRFLGRGKEHREAGAGRLTEQRNAFNLKELNRSCPELGNVLRFVFVARALE